MALGRRASVPIAACQPAPTTPFRDLNNRRVSPSAFIHWKIECVEGTSPNKVLKITIDVAGVAIIGSWTR